MAGVGKNLKLAKELVLKENEAIVYALSGSFKTKSLGQDALKNGVLLATDNRIVFFAKRFTGYDSETYKYSNISSMDTGKKLLGKTITFYASGNEITMNHIMEDHYQEFVEYVENRIGKKESAPQTDDNLTQIKKLKELLDMDAITQDEYNAKKNELLGL